MKMKLQINAFALSANFTTEISVSGSGSVTAVLPSGRLVDVAEAVRLFDENEDAEQTINRLREEIEELREKLAAREVK
jgi:hypothetical protein